MALMRGGVVIPAYGKPDLTDAVVNDCVRERELVLVVVVDNAGGYDAPEAADIEVLRPGRNLGWLAGTNVGVDAARAAGCDWLVALNNDTRLSDGFFAGLRDALELRTRDLVAPCYDGVVREQSEYWSGPIEGFTPEPVERTVKRIDGTCYALTTELYGVLGELDGRHFGRRGWGAIEDYMLRVRALGGDSVVTHRSYLTHFQGSTAHSVSTRNTYNRYAAAEMRRGLRHVYGADWRRHFPDMAGPPDSTRQRLSDVLRAVEDRLGLSETAIGRRGPRHPTPA
jgi:GT2 family glycosyltransferase